MASSASAGREREAERRNGRGVRWSAVVASALALALLPGTNAVAQTAPAGQAELEAAMLTALRAASFEQTIDFGPLENVCPGAAFCSVPARPVRHMPNIDLAVIELDAAGNATRAANVVLDRNFPSGFVAPIDTGGGPAGSYGVSGVRWRRWDQERYDGGTFDPANGQQLTVKGWNDNPVRTDADDIVPGRQAAPSEFMAPYPASLFKLIVAFRVMRLVDMGELSLDQPVTWDPTPGSPYWYPAPGAEAEVSEPEPELHGDETPVASTPPVTPTPPADDALTRPVREWLDKMITISDNDSTRALLKLLWDRRDLAAMHAELHKLGLDTLQINGTDPATGRNWQPGAIHMTSMDTARLLWLIEGGSGPLWTRPDGSPVSASILSDGSRAHLKSLLDDQGFHEVLSNSNLCGAPHTQAGIPALVPERWIQPDGTVQVGDWRYGHDVRPCNATAEVVFGHKTGWTYNFGSNAGIVRSLPDRAGRRYIISFIASLGARYTDPVFASQPRHPCDEFLICYTQRIPALARQLDRYLAPAP